MFHPKKFIHSQYLILPDYIVFYRMLVMKLQHLKFIQYLLMIVLMLFQLKPIHLFEYKIYLKLILTFFHFSLAMLFIKIFI